MNTADLSEDQRRSQQMAVGLRAQAEQEAPDMEQQQATRGTPKQNPALSAVSRMADALEERPSWKDIAVLELKKATVYVPILLSTALTVMWARRRFFS